MNGSANDNAFTPEAIAELLGLPQPTRQQAAVISAPLEPLLVVAGAGSGKTETMAARAVYLVANGLVAPDQILGLTFTKKAASELQQRVERRLLQLSNALAGVGTAAAGDMAPGPTVATYNAFAGGIVKEFGLWLAIDPSATLLTEASLWQLASNLVAKYEGPLGTRYRPATITESLLRLAGQLREHLADPAELARYLTDVADSLDGMPFGARRRVAPKEVADLLASVETRRQLLPLVDALTNEQNRINAVTFGDQVALAAELAASVPVVAAAAQAQYRVVFLDEYQDTSHAQVEFLANLFGGGHAVTAVGDPNQAIYGWRGASAAGLAQFPTEFRRATGEPARVLPLATAWRNDAAILATANATAKPLRDAAHVSVPELQLSPAAADGHVSAVVVETIDDESAVVADWTADQWRQGRSVAVLCRKRKQFPPFAQALAERGVPVEIVGLGGLLAAPAVVDLIAFLQVVADPERGDWLLRLLTGPRVNLGAADLHALGAWARQLNSRGQAAANAPSGLRDAPSLVAAIAQLPAVGSESLGDRDLSEAALSRLRRLAAGIQTVRSMGSASLAELCGAAERELGLDIEVALASTYQPASRGRAALDAFRAVAGNYAATATDPTLLGFLDWLSAAETRERGLEMPVVEIDHSAVQLITIHAAKGLEWDAVAVPGLVDGCFPSSKESSAGRLDGGWLTDHGALPFALRGDRGSLPLINFDQPDQVALVSEIKRFKADCGAGELEGERRLAYVAFTRARHAMLLTGYRWDASVKPKAISPFLAELAEGGLVARDEWAADPAAGAENPYAAGEVTACWPAAETEYAKTVRRGAEAVREAIQSHSGGTPLLDAIAPGTAGGAGLAIGSSHDAEACDSALANGRADPLHESAAVGDLVHLARLLLAEREHRETAEVAMPKHLSASNLVALARDPEEFALQVRRPMPQRPSGVSQLGTRFHEWVQGHLAPGIRLLDDVIAELGAPEEMPSAELERLKTAFLGSQWAAMDAKAVEQEVHQQIGGVNVVARIDAVFADPADPGMDIVVDWKTGQPGSTVAERDAREVQLAIYRLAWSRISGKPLSQVSAAFHYVGTGETVRQTKLWSEPQLATLIAGQH